jgi:hypothetical protein
MHRQVARSGWTIGRGGPDVDGSRTSTALTQASSIAGSGSQTIRHCWPLWFSGWRTRRSAPAPYTEVFCATKFSTTGGEAPRPISSLLRFGSFFVSWFLGFYFVAILASAAVQPPRFIGLSLLAATGSPVSRLLPNSERATSLLTMRPKRLGFPFLNSYFRNAV